MDETRAQTTIDSQARVDQTDHKRIKPRALAPGIYTHPLFRGGRPCIKGTSLKVTDIVVQQKYWGQSPAEIAQHFDIKASQVEDALNYYAAHTDYIDTDIELDDINHQQLEEAQDGTLRDLLLSRRKSLA